MSKGNFKQGRKRHKKLLDLPDLLMLMKQGSSTYPRDFNLLNFDKFNKVSQQTKILFLLS